MLLNTTKLLRNTVDYVYQKSWGCAAYLRPYILNALQLSSETLFTAHTTERSESEIGGIKFYKGNIAVFSAGIPLSCYIF